MSRRSSVVALAVVAVVLAGCEADAPPERSPRIAPGICVAGEIRDQGNPVPDLSTVVDCRERHAYEVFDVIDLPRDALTGTTPKERVANRDDLALPRELSQDSVERVAFEKFSDRRCLASWQRVTGYADIRPGGKSAQDAEVLPALLGVSLGYSVMPEDPWLEGRQEVLCTARFFDAEADGKGRRPSRARSSADDALISTSVRSAFFPLGLRACRAYDDRRKNVSVRPCTEPHVAEVLFFFEADAVFGQGFVDGLRDRPTAKKFDRFDDVCTAALPVLLGRDYDRKHLRGFGSTARTWTEKSTPVRCDVGPTNFRNRDLPAGSLVGTGAEMIRFVPVN